MNNTLKLIDYLSLNACSVNSSDLYNGKAGISLCLFEISRILQDKYIEDQAFELIQESLLTKNEDIGFENGLSGIGYVLLYLIENKFVEADFEELFGSRQKKIEDYIERLTTMEGHKEKFVRYNLKIVFFLNTLLSRDRKYRNIATLLTFLSDTALSVLEKYASSIENKQETQLKTEYVAFLETYLKAAVICRKFNYPVEASVTYSRLFRQNKLASDYAIGYYLDKIATQKNDKRLREVAEINRQSGLKNIYPETMSLARRIEMLYLLQQDWELYGEQIELLENGLFKDVSQHSLEKNLLSAIRTDCFVAGYQFGISRFLLYWIYRNADKVTRMRLPFL